MTPRVELSAGPTFRRLRLVFRFKNELVLFADVGHSRPYCLTVSRCVPLPAISFVCLSNLFHPTTIDQSFAHDGAGIVSSIKTDDDAFEVRGHARRAVTVTEMELRLFARLFDRPGTPANEARLPLIIVTSSLVCCARWPTTRGTCATRRSRIRLADV